MRVLHVSWEFPPRLFGGLGRHVDGLTRGLVPLGVCCEVLTPAAPPAEDLPDGLTVTRAAATPPLPPAQWVADVLAANLVMLERGEAGPPPDLVHVHDWMASFAGMALAQRWRIPLVATVHATERGRWQGFLPEGISTWIDGHERRLVAAADAVIVCSAWMRDQVTVSIEADRDAVSVIPNGVAADAWTGPRQPDPALVVFAGRVEHEKGVFDLLDAAAALDGAFRAGIRVVVAGTGTQAAAVARRVADESLPVRLTGRLPQPALAALFRNASVVVVPSRYEPFGLVALEAMAAGCAVVATEVGGLPDLIEPGHTGVLVAPGDPAALAAAVRGLLNDPATAQRLGRAAAASAADRPWHAAAVATRTLYERCVRAGR